MPAPITTTITGPVLLPDGSVPVNSTVIFTLTGFDTDTASTATLLPHVIEAEIDATGEISVALWGNDQGQRATFYNVSVFARGKTSDITTALGPIVVPNSGSYDLSLLLAVAPPPSITVDEYLAQLQAAVASAQAAADRAEAVAPFGTRAELVTWAASNTPVDGREYRAGLSYVGSTGATDIADLPGLLPLGDVSFDHFNVPATGAETLLAVAMQWSIDNSRKLKDSGSYELDGQVTLDFDGGNLIWDTLQCTFTASATFPGSGTRMFMITGGQGNEVTFDWNMGRFFGGNMPSEGTLSSNDVVSISVSNSTITTTLRNAYFDMSDGVNPDYRLAGGDTCILVNSANINLDNIVGVGAEDVLVYVTGSPSTSGNRRGSLVAKGLYAKGCRNGAIQVKRDFEMVDIEYIAEDCLMGGGVGPAGDSGGNTFTTSVTAGRIKGTTKNCAYPFHGQRSIGLHVEVEAMDIGFYLPADGATGAAELAFTDAGVKLLGCIGTKASIIVDQVNPDLITALGGGYVPADFRGVYLDGNTGSGTGVGPILPSYNVIDMVLIDIPKPAHEAAGSNNHITYLADGDSVASVITNATSTISETGTTLDLRANNNGGVAGNFIKFVDTDGSASSDQPSGAIEAWSNDGGTVQKHAYLESRSRFVAGQGEWVFGTGTLGSPVDTFRVTSYGDVQIIRAGNGVEFLSPDGLVTKVLTIDNAGSAVWT
jgi:hypothetical protein